MNTDILRFSSYFQSGMAAKTHDEQAFEEEEREETHYAKRF